MKLNLRNVIGLIYLHNTKQMIKTGFFFWEWGMRVTNDSDSNGPSCTIMNAKILYTHFFGSCRRENFPKKHIFTTF